MGKQPTAKNMGILSSDFDLSAVIPAARTYGLPVKLLEEIQLRYIRLESSEDAVMPALNIMYLTPNVLANIANIDPRLPFGEGPALATLYHEATHAFMDLHSGDVDLRQIVTAADDYYQGAPLADGSQADDPARVTQEAAASFVGHRVYWYWSTLENLIVRIERKRLDKIALQDIVSKYNASSGQSSFGYQDVGHLWWKRQQETTKPIHPKLRRYCEEVILESKIPAVFSSAHYLNWILQENNIASP